MMRGSPNRTYNPVVSIRVRSFLNGLGFLVSRLVSGGNADLDEVAASAGLVVLLAEEVEPAMLE